MNLFHASPSADAVVRIVARRPLAWSTAPDDRPIGTVVDRTPHPRAASAVVWIGERLGVVQDDASFLALVDPATGAARSVALPAGADGRRRFEPALGNKGLKLDLEAAVAWRDAGAGTWHWLALGSGSTSAREQVVHAVLADGAREAVAARVLGASGLYAALRRDRGFAGDELNVEGAAVVGERLRLFQRGNGAAQAPGPFGVGREIVDATVDLDLGAVRRWLAGDGPEPMPLAGSARRYALGTLPGEAGPVRLTFTDASAGEGGEVWFLAAAEDSPDSYDDGAVAGAAVGRLAADGSVVGMARLVDGDGRPVALKTEGLVLDRADPTFAWVVVDMDDPARAAELLRVDLGALARRPRAG